MSVKGLDLENPVGEKPRSAKNSPSGGECWM
jgi:hypothetical protein